MLTGVVLCGGRSRRMGEDKAFLEVAGQPWCLHIAAQLQPLVDKVVFSVNEDQLSSFEGHDCIIDQYPDKGPLGGLYSLSKALEGELLVVATDLKDITTSILTKLTEVPTPHAATCFVSEEDEDRRQIPLCFILNTSELRTFFAKQAEISGSVRFLLKSIDTKYISLTKSDFLCLKNYNQPEDLKA